jgi:hypothetical protein
MRIQKFLNWTVPHSADYPGREAKQVNISTPWCEKLPTARSIADAPVMSDDREG